MSGSSGMHGGGGGINGVKLEGLNGGGGGGGGGGSGGSSSVAAAAAAAAAATAAGGAAQAGYYCNSYTPPAPVDHGLLSTAYSKRKTLSFPFWRVDLSVWLVVQRQVLLTSIPIPTTITN